MQGLRPASGVICAGLQQLMGAYWALFLLLWAPCLAALHSCGPPSGPLPAAPRSLMWAMSLFWAQLTYRHLTTACLD